MFFFNFRKLTTRVKSSAWYFRKVCMFGREVPMQASRTREFPSVKWSLSCVLSERCSSNIKREKLGVVMCGMINLILFQKKIYRQYQGQMRDHFNRGRMRTNCAFGGLWLNEVLSRVLITRGGRKYCLIWIELEISALFWNWKAPEKEEKMFLGAIKM